MTTTRRIDVIAKSRIPALLFGRSVPLKAVQSSLLLAASGAIIELDARESGRAVDWASLNDQAKEARGPGGRALVLVSNDATAAAHKFVRELLESTQGTPHVIALVETATLAADWARLFSLALPIEEALLPSAKATKALF